MLANNTFANNYLPLLGRITLQAVLNGHTATLIPLELRQSSLAIILQSTFLRLLAVILLLSWQKGLKEPSNAFYYANGLLVLDTECKHRFKKKNLHLSLAIKVGWSEQTIKKLGILTQKLKFLRNLQPFSFARRNRNSIHIRSVTIFLIDGYRNVSLAGGYYTQQKVGRGLTSNSKISIKV